MAQLKLYKGTQTEYNTKKDKIADGGLVLVKDGNTSATADLYIKEGSGTSATYIKVSDNDAYNNLNYVPDTGLLLGQKVKGDTKTILTVDSALSNNSKNPVQNRAVTTRFDTLINADTGKSIRTIANEEFTTQLLSGTANAKFKTFCQIGKAKFTYDVASEQIIISFE